MQFVANKRWAKGVTLNATYTWVPRWTETGANTTTGIGEAFVDDVSLTREQRARTSRTASTASPRRACGSCRGCATVATCVGMLLGGWSIAPMFIYQSGQPWTMPGNVDLAVDPAVAALNGEKDGQFIYGVQPCVGQRNADGRLRPAVGLDGLRLHRAVLPGSRSVPAPHGDGPLRRVPPADVLAGGPQLRQDDADHRQGAACSSASRPSTSSTARCTTSASTTRRPTSADFGRINRNTTGQNNFQRFVQLGFRVTF